MIPSRTHLEMVKDYVLARDWSCRLYINQIDLAHDVGVKSFVRLKADGYQDLALPKESWEFSVLDGSVHAGHPGVTWKVPQPDGKWITWPRIYGALVLSGDALLTACSTPMNRGFELQSGMVFNAPITLVFSDKGV